jgi:biopolymer transport protein ExbB
LLVILSVLSLAVMFERVLFYARHKADPIGLREALIGAVDSGRADAALKHLQSRKKGKGGMEVNVLYYGLSQLDKGPRAVEELMAGALSRERRRYDRFLGFLGTLGNNAPFIGLFGTVLGVIQAFDALGRVDLSGEGATGAAVMGPIAEALIATAVGLLVAIPAVIAFNIFKARVRGVVSNTELLSRTLVAHMHSESGPEEEAA